VSGTKGAAFADPPQAQRPKSPPPSYGVPTEGGELMSWTFVTERLENARNYWIVTVGRGETPHSAPVWGAFVADDLYFETSPGTRKARNLVRNPAVVVHTESGDEVVIVEGSATPVHPTADSGARIARAFAAKYEGYEPDPSDCESGALFLVVFAWRDMPTATCWRFR
jgi:nitroimidazol reductase NimA-like FMN-containing flavoprotein (pyridoxamine 5'-phosphate oxidase superfamily)